MKADGGETMPWWIWLLLALFMLAMVVSGVVYACLHGYRAFKDVAKLGERTAKRIEAMGKPLPQNNENEAPFFTRPLKDAADRYADAHAGVIERHEAKRSRHAQQWAQWRHCNA